MSSPAPVNSWVGVVAVSASVIIFGLAPPLARLAYDAGSNPVTLVEVRFLAASTMLLALLAWRRRRDRSPLGGAPIPLLLVIGIATAISSGGYMGAVEHIPASMASLLFYTFPIQVTFLAAALGQERLTALRLGAGAVCLVGVALAIGVAPVFPNLIGVAMALAAASGVATLIVLSAKAMQRMNQLAVQASSTLTALACFTIWLISSGGPAWPTTSMGWMALIVAALSSAVANIIFLFGLGKIGAGRAALLANLEPLTVLALAPLILNEHLTWLQLCGAGLVLAAITILPILEAQKRV